MKMKGIWKRLATLTIMAALVLCLLPMGASAAYVSDPTPLGVGSVILSIDGGDKGVKYGITRMPSESTNGTVDVCANTGSDFGNDGVVTIPNKITINEMEFTVDGIVQDAFKNCTALQSISYPAGITVGDGAFKGTSATCATHRFGENSNGVCEVCDYECEHKNLGADGKCTVCHTDLVASVSVGDNTLYFIDATAALKYAEGVENDTVTILKNVTVDRGTVKANLVVKPDVTLTFPQAGENKSSATVTGSISGGGTIGGQQLTLTVWGDCADCIFYAKVENYGTVTGGTFEKGIDNYGTVKGGTVHGTLQNAKGDLDGVEKIGVVYADNITLGTEFEYEAEEGTTLHCTHTHGTAATCVAAQTCPFDCTGLANIDPNAHSLSYAAEGNVITETCAHGCAAPATATLEINTGSVVYTGEEQGVPATVTHSETWRGAKLTAQYENNINVGTATVYIQAGEAKAVKTFEITKATLTVEHFDITLPKNAVYDGTAKAAEVKLAEPYTKCGAIAVRYFAGETELEAPINAGTYTVKFSVAEGTNFSAMALTEAGSFTIAKANPVVTEPTAKIGLVYNGTAQPLFNLGEYKDDCNENEIIHYWIDDIHDNFTTDVISQKDAGEYIVKWYAGSDSSGNYKKVIGQMTVTIDPATITVTPTANQSMTYGADIPTLDFTDSGRVSTEVPGFTGKLTIDGTKAGTYKIKKGTLALADDAGFKASNYTLVVDENVDFVINKAALTVKAKAQEITYGEEIAKTESMYTVTGLVDGDKATVTLTPSTANITESGTITPAVTIINAAGEDVTECYDISKNSAKLVIKPDLSVIEGLTTSNVHHSKKKAIEELQADLNGATEDTATQDAIKNAKETCATLLVQINESLDALRTDAIEDTLGTTASNVKLADKATITRAIADIKTAKETYKNDNFNNYSDEDIAKLDAQTAKLNAALDAIANAEEVIALMNALPADVEPDDDKAIEAKKAYDALTSNEKNMVASSAATKLAALTTYKIVKGDKATWEKGKTLTFTINGDYERFKRDGMVRVDGKKVDDKYYTAKAGSTIITLEKSFFEQKSISSKATHEIIFMFGDGEVRGTFYIHKDAMTPATGDTSGIVVWVLVFFASAAALAAVYVIFRKRKNA